MKIFNNIWWKVGENLGSNRVATLLTSPIQDPDLAASLAQPRLSRTFRQHNDIRRTGFIKRRNIRVSHYVYLQDRTSSECCFKYPGQEIMQTNTAFMDIGQTSLSRIHVLIRILQVILPDQPISSPLPCLDTHHILQTSNACPLVLVAPGLSRYSSPKFRSTAFPGLGSGLEVENLEAENTTPRHVRKST